MRHRAHSEGVVTDDPRAPAQDVGCRGPRSCCAPRRVHEPSVQLPVAAIEFLDVVLVT